MTPESEQAYLDGLSAEARALLTEEVRRPRAAPPAPDDFAAWSALQQETEARCVPACERALALYGPRLSAGAYADMPALLVRPQDVPEERPPLIFLHGGGYTLFSARSSLFASVPLAADLGRTLIALDYPLAPQASFTTTVPATARALDAVLERHPGAALAGDSAGGGLAVAACNRLLRQPGRRPAKLVLISPWLDLAERGDTRLTLRAHDPLLRYEPGLAACAAAYAGTALDDPDASPVGADFDDRFPPTLLLCGTREILLSDSVRLCRRLRDSGVHAILDLYEGLHHSFPVVTPQTPEAASARAAIKTFLDS